MPYRIPLPDGKLVEFPDDYPREKAKELVQRHIDKKYPKTPGAGGQFAREALLGAGPMAAGLAAFGPSAALGAPLGGIGGLATGLVGSTAAALAAAYGQEKLLESAPEVAKTLGVDPETLARGREANPVASTLGQLAPMVATFRPSSPLALFRKPKGDTPEAIEAALKARRGERIAAAAGAGLGGGVDAAMQLAGEAPFDPLRAALATGAGAIFRDPNRLGRRLLGERGMGPFARPTPEGEAPPPEGEAPPEFTALDAAIAKAEDALSRKAEGKKITASYFKDIADELGVTYPEKANSDVLAGLLKDRLVDIKSLREPRPPIAATAQGELFEGTEYGAPPAVESPVRMEQGELFPTEQVPAPRVELPQEQGDLFPYGPTPEPVAPEAAAPPEAISPEPVPPAPEPVQEELDLRFPQEQGDLFAVPEPIPPRGVAPEPEAPAIERSLPGEEQLPLTGVDTPEVLAAKNAAQTVLDKAASGTRYEARVLRKVADSVGAEAPKNANSKRLLKAIDAAVNPPEPTPPVRPPEEQLELFGSPPARRSTVEMTQEGLFPREEPPPADYGPAPVQGELALEPPPPPAPRPAPRPASPTEQAELDLRFPQQQGDLFAEAEPIPPRGIAPEPEVPAVERPLPGEEQLPLAGIDTPETLAAKNVARTVLERATTGTRYEARALRRVADSLGVTAPKNANAKQLLGVIDTAVNPPEPTPEAIAPEAVVPAAETVVPETVVPETVAPTSETAAPDEPAFDAELANRATQAFSQNAAEAVPPTPAESPTPRAEPVVVAPAVSQSPFSNLIRQGGFKQAVDSLSTAKTPLFKAVSTAIKNVLGDSPSRVVAEGNQLAPEDAAVVGRLKAEGKVAEYDPKTDTYFFTNEGMTPKTFLHEAIHASSIQVLKAFKEGGKLTGVQRSAAKRIDDIFEKSKPLLGDQFQSAYDNVYEFLSAALTDGDLQRALAKLKSEDLGMTFGKAKAPTVWDRVVDAVARMFGLDRTQMDNALLQVANSFEDVLAAPRAGVDMAPLPSRKTAPPVSGNRTIDQMTRDLSDDSTTISTREKLGRPFNMGREALKQFTRKGVQQFVKLFQNVQVYAKDLQKALRAAGINTRIYDVLSSLGSETQIRWMASQGIRQGIDSALGRYMSKLGLDENGVYKRLHMLAIGASERELRQVLFMQKVPLSEAADTRRIQILDEVSSGVSEQRAMALRKELDALIAKDIATPNAALYVRGQLQNLSEPAKLSDALDIDSKLYNGVGEYTKDELQSLRDFYQKEYADNPEIRELFDPDSGLFKQLKDYTIKNNKEAGFHPDQLDSLLTFYGRANYMPFKGTAGVAYADEVEALNYGSTRLGGRATELQNKQEGRQSDSNNPFLQLISDAAKSASRIGTSDLVDEVVALSKVMPDKIRRVEASDVNFNQRYMANTQREDLNAKDRIFRHRADGELEIWEIKDPELLEAVKGFIDDPKIGWQALNKVTSTIASFHTRYNPAFPVYNFVRDAITSGGIVGAELGAGVGVRYASSVVSQITNGGLLKAGKVARLFQAGRLDEINKLAASGDEFYKSLANYINDGGVVTYQEAINTKSLQDELRKNLASQLGKKWFARTRANVVDAFDVWTNTFELATRAAGYDAILPEMVARRQQQLGRKLTAAERAEVGKETSQYVRQLFNYSEVGKYGREMGAFFMFMRPAMTGAVRFWEAFSPAFSSIESRMASVPKEVFDVPTVQKMLQEQAVAQGQDVSGQAAKDALRASAEQEVAKRRDTYINNFKQQQQSARIVTMAAAGAGFALYNMSLMMSDNDEMGRNKVLTDNMDIWQRNLRIPLPKDALGEGIDFLQVPWGFGFGAFAAFGSQIAAVTSGGQSFTDALENAIPIAIDSAFPVPAPQYSPFDNPGAFFTSLMLPSAARPFVEYAMNVDAFGREIYQNRINQFGNPYTGGETLPEAYTLASSLLADAANAAGMDVPEFVTPKTLHFFANSYIDGIARLSASGVGLASALGGAREIDLKEDVLPIASFLGRSSSVDAREYADISKKVSRIDNQLKIFEDSPEQLARYLERVPNAEIIVKYYNQQTYGRLRDVRQRANQIRRDRDLSIAEKRKLLDELNFERDMIMRNTMESVNAWM
jgi:hypothetical protein